MDVFNKIQEIYRDIFDDENLVILRETVANDIEDWDSFAHINIIASCETNFNVKFSIDEIIALKSVGDFVDSVKDKCLQKK